MAGDGSNVVGNHDMVSSWDLLYAQLAHERVESGMKLEV